MSHFNQEQIRTLGDYGISQNSLALEPHKYLKCQACFRQFEWITLIPNQLVCNHLMCAQCSNSLEKCYMCPEKIEIKQLNFQVILQMKKPNTKPKSDQHQNINKNQQFGLNNPQFKQTKVERLKSGFYFIQAKILNSHILPEQNNQSRQKIQNHNQEQPNQYYISRKFLNFMRPNNHQKFVGNNPNQINNSNQNPTIMYQTFKPNHQYYNRTQNTQFNKNQLKKQYNFSKKRFSVYPNANLSNQLYQVAQRPIEKQTLIERFLQRSQSKILLQKMKTSSKEHPLDQQFIVGSAYLCTINILFKRNQIDNKNHTTTPQKIYFQIRKKKQKQPSETFIVKILNQASFYYINNNPIIFCEKMPLRRLIKLIQDRILVEAVKESQKIGNKKYLLAKNSQDNNKFDPSLIHFNDLTKYQ